MSQHEDAIESYALAEAKAYSAESAWRRHGFFDGLETGGDDDNHNRSKPREVHLFDLTNYYETEVSRLNALSEYTQEVLTHEGEWIPVYYNQETEFDDIALQDWLYNLGDRADCQFDA